MNDLTNLVISQDQFPYQPIVITHLLMNDYLIPSYYNLKVTAVTNQRMVI